MTGPFYNPPFDGPLEIREMDIAGGQVELRLGSRKSVEEAVDEFRAQLEAVASRV